MEAASRPLVALYCHIPFCVQKCSYCDFCSYTGLTGMFGAYLEALVHDLDEIMASHSFTIGSVYFGGGTPTIMPATSFKNILDRIPIEMRSIAETTVEANPGTVSRSALRILRSAGIDRISLGVQSLIDRELRLLGRIHDRENAVQTIREARAEGFDNINADLIFGLPEQTMSDWQQTLEEMLQQELDHISVYGLHLERGTKLARWVEQGTVPPIDDELMADMYEFTVERLGAAGYDHYEISNWARPGKRCAHNLTYWHNQEYVGIGAGAWSYWNNKRWGNIEDPKHYIKQCLRSESVVGDCEAVSKAQEMADTLMLGLRLTHGIQRGAFEERFGHQPEDVYCSQIRHLLKLGLLDSDDDRLRLTHKGRLLGNEVFEQFLASV